MTEAEMDELRFLLILSKMKENAEKVYGGAQLKVGHLNE